MKLMTMLPFFKMKNYFMLLCIISVFSCEDDKGDIDIYPDNLLIGNWTDPVYDNGTTTFKRTSSLPEDAYGITFKSGGDFILRSSGFCGTPPLVFYNDEGAWTRDENLIKVSQPNSYPNFYNWHILELTENELKIKTVRTEKEEDYSVLLALFDNIYTLSTSIACTDSNNWDFVAFGSKACGGPQGYIAYSKTIDVQSFLQKVQAYTEAERLFNIKWDIVSDCALINEPIGVACENNFPVLKY